MTIELRTVSDADLPIFFEFQRDPVAAEMAAFGSRQRLDDHVSHWREKILGNPDAVARTVVADGEVAGNMLSWRMDGVRYVGYWISRELWGRGVGSAALRMFVAEIAERPLYALVVVSNKGSQRVLEKADFVRIEQRPSPEDGLDEYVYRLD